MPYPDPHNPAQKLAAALALLQRRVAPETRLQEGIEAFHRGDSVRAMDLLAPLLDALPGNPLPPAYLAFICAERGLAREAEDFLARALSRAPERADLEAALGEIFLKVGKAEAAARHLQNALAARPELLAAYPALAQSLHLLGRTDEAIALLQGVAAMPEAADTPIRPVLLELLAARGDLATFAESCLRHARGLADALLAARCLARIDPQGDRLLSALLAAQEKLADSLPPLAARRAMRQAAPWRIAFMASDFRREERLGRLQALLTHLPVERFVTGLVINDPEAAQIAGAQLSALLADHTLEITGKDDAAALARLEDFAPDVLIDLDAYDPAERLAVFLAASAPTKLLWGEAPLPPIAAEVLPICGEALADPALPSLNLAGLGECLDLPDLPLREASAPQKRGRAKALAAPTRFACLTPAIRLGPAAWELFAAALQQAPQSTLTLNLGELGEAARNFLCRQFARLEIAPERLRFIQPENLEALCRAWRSIDIGLAAPVDAGERALPACLWMGRPYIALASGLPWSHRPAALLRLAGAQDWLAATPEDFAALARRPAPAPNPEFRQRLMAAGLTDPAGFARDFAERLVTHLLAGTSPSANRDEATP